MKKNNIPSVLFNSKIGIKLIAAFLLSTMLPLALVLIYIQNQVTNQMLEIISFANEKAFMQANDMFAYRIEGVSGTVASIFSNTELLTVLSRDRNSSTHSEIANDVQRINQILLSMESQEDISKVTLYLPPEDPLLDYSTHYNAIDSIVESIWFQDLRSPLSEAPWVLRQDSGGKHIVSMARNIYSSADYTNPIAVICIDLNSKALIEILKNAINTEGAKVFLLNTRNDVILSSEEDESWPYNDEIPKTHELTDSTSNKIMIDGQWMFIFIRKTGRLNWLRPNWTLLSITPIENIQQPVKRSITGVMLVALVSTLVFSLFAFLFTASITKRINSLISGMRKMQEGNLNVTIIPRGRDEISELTADFNYMTKRIGILLEENAKQIDISRRNELMALQSQINPHFLYNSLDLINWTAVNRDIPEIYETVQALSKFYKLSLGQGKNIVSLHDEIQHVCAYMDIERRRFDDAIVFINTVPESLFEFAIVKLTLQPLIENAIIHGIMKKSVRKGTITLTAKEESKAITLQIHDDGMGFDKEKLQSILQSSFSPENGYGLSNVNTRIKLYFGKPYGLNIESVAGEHTKVTVTLPCIRYNAEL